MIVAEGKFIQIQRQIILRNLMIGADHATLQQRPEALDVVGVDISAHVFAFAVIDGLVMYAFVEIPIGRILIGRDQRDLLAHGFG